MRDDSSAVLRKAMATEVRTAAAPPIGDANPIELKLRSVALVELAVFLIGAALVQWWLLEPATLASLKPHPFWIPVVLLSLQYGTIEGIVAVAACTVTQWLLGWPLPVDESYIGELLPRLGEPMLWLGAAVV